jgi:hypothetical protein
MKLMNNSGQKKGEVISMTIKRTLILALAFILVVLTVVCQKGI